MAATCPVWLAEGAERSGDSQQKLQMWRLRYLCSLPFSWKMSTSDPRGSEATASSHSRERGLSPPGWSEVTLAVPAGPELGQAPLDPVTP